LAQPQIWVFAAIGFTAQMFDGALGMGFGAISSTALTIIGVPREVASASVNGAKILTGTASGLSHVAFRNVNWRMLVVLAIAGGCGGAIGALLLAESAGRWIGLATSVYLLGVGVFIIWRAAQLAPQVVRPGRATGVGFAGGLLEAISGVWGPLVTSNLVALGATPRQAVGTGCIAETFVAAIVFGVLGSKLGFAQLSGGTVGLLLGGIVAAPFAARMARDIARRPLMIGIGTVVLTMSVLRLWRDLSN
jgi:uncharacterized membrane protein YfcA